MKLVSRDPIRAASKFVFCHRVMDPEVMVLVMRCRFGSHAAKAIITSATATVTAMYLGRMSIPESETILVIEGVGLSQPGKR